MITPQRSLLMATTVLLTTGLALPAPAAATPTGAILRPHQSRLPAGHHADPPRPRPPWGNPGRIPFAPQAQLSFGQGPFVTGLWHTTTGCAGICTNQANGSAGQAGGLCAGVCTDSVNGGDGGPGAGGGPGQRGGNGGVCLGVCQHSANGGGGGNGAAGRPGGTGGAGGDGGVCVGSCLASANGGDGGIGGAGGSSRTAVGGHGGAGGDGGADGRRLVRVRPGNRCWC